MQVFISSVIQFDKFIQYDKSIQNEAKSRKNYKSWGGGEVVGYLIYLELLGRFLMHAK